MSLDQKIADAMLHKAWQELDLSGKTPNNEPTLVILGGQPGAGKSSIIDMIEERFNSNIVVLNGDEFKPYYPGYKQLLRTDPDEASKIVQDYSNYVVDAVKQELMQQGYNLIIEGTMRNPNTPIDTAKLAHNNGYLVEACVIATNYYASRVGCVKRYELDKLDSGVGRSVPVASHDEAYSNIPTTIKALLESGQFDNIQIFSRNGEILGNLIDGENLAQIYVSYRESVSPQLYQETLQNLDAAKMMKESRAAPMSELLELDNLKAELMKKHGLQNKAINELAITDKTTNSEILDYFEQYNSALIGKIRKAGRINDPIHYVSLKDEKPQDLAEYLAEKCNADVKLVTNNKSEAEITKTIKL